MQETMHLRHEGIQYSHDDKGRNGYAGLDEMDGIAGLTLQIRDGNRQDGKINQDDDTEGNPPGDGFRGQ